MQISEAAAGAPSAGAEPCRFPKLEECAHFHYERVQLPKLSVTLQSNTDASLHSQHHGSDGSDSDWFMVQVTSGDECWLVQRNLENFKMLDAQLHQCIYDRKISQLEDLSTQDSADLEAYLRRFSEIADNSVNCGPVLNWLQMDNKGHRLLVPSEESRSINTPAVAAAYSVRRYVSQARDELNLEVGDMISVIDMASPGESMWWRGKRGFQVGFFPQHCVHIIGDKVPRNMPLPPPVVGSLAISPIKPVLRRHGKLITFFRSFLLNRPSRRRLKQTGILKERVFGCDLGEHLLNSGHDIPTVLKCCAEFIETHGIVDGIYRLSGVTSNIQKLRNAFDEDRIPDLYTEDILQDIHSVASLLKMYFRELPNPLCTYQLYQSFVNAVQGCNSGARSSESDHDRLLKMREAVQKLPPPHYRTLEYLTRHLARVAKHGPSTGMTTRNVAIVWAPNLLRCAELEIGGVAALQGVGVQAVVTEFLICYAELIFCDHLPNVDLPPTAPDSPRRCRPKSLAISTPTRLITLEEARNKRLSNSSSKNDAGYIEVGGGPKNLPKKYHTVIELPGGGGPRKRTHQKRSPLGWRSLFSTKNRNGSQGALNNNNKARKATTPGITAAEKSVTESDLTDMKRKLRSVKSAESLTSGHSEPTSTEIDGLGPLFSLNKPPGHNRSVSHDSYFDTLQPSTNNSELSLLDLSEIQLNFDLEETEMRIFSEDESLVSSPRNNQQHRKYLTRARPEDFSSSATNSGNPSPKKQARVVLSPDSFSRKRTRLEEQLGDIQYIDCTTPENLYCSTTVTADVHYNEGEESEAGGEPKNKSPRNSSTTDSNIYKRQSLNLEQQQQQHHNSLIPKSLTDNNITANNNNTPTPLSPSYKTLGESSTNTTSSPTTTEIIYQNLNSSDNSKKNHYENILTTISITYKSPPRSIESSPIKTHNLDSDYENVLVNVVENAVIPTSTASLPSQEASQPDLSISTASNTLQSRPKSLNDLEDTNDSLITTLRHQNLSSGAVCDTSEQLSLVSYTHETSNQSSRSNIEYTPSIASESLNYQQVLSQTDLSLSEILHSSTENLSENLSQSFPSLSKDSTPNVSPVEPEVAETVTKTEKGDDDSIYQQVKFFRRSIHEVNALLDLDDANKTENIDENNENKTSEDDSLEDSHVYENVKMGVRDLKKFYEKDSLPPCLRARNLKNQMKTRSLDEEEFKKECANAPRRKSLDESGGYKTNSLPKTLNPPKTLPIDNDSISSIHLSHGGTTTIISEKSETDDEAKKRERIEKYKEERRKFLQEKYRSESFKEDKDVLLSRLKIFTKKDGDDDVTINKTPTPATTTTKDKETSSNLKSRAAMFEQPPVTTTTIRHHHDDNNKSDTKVERRRHTYENRERERDSERPRRISLDSKSQRTSPPSYCIKDMKAIFESKSKQ